MESPPTLHQPSSHEARPRGILKNPSYDHSSATSPPKYVPASPLPVPTPDLDSPENKELTLQNTLQNAGHRRSSSAARRSSNVRRKSSLSAHGDDENNPRLKWDEANLYLTEQERTSTMKITEPKTPYAPGYDPTEDDAAMAEEAAAASIDVDDLVVDELDGKKQRESIKRTKTDEIPGLELGEPEESISGAFDLSEEGRITRERSLSAAESNGSAKHVDVGAEDGVHDGNDESEKHRQFEQRRKQHYEMTNVKDLLGHPEDLDEMDEEDDAPAPPPVPSNFTNGS